jgi:hypothetical protein
MKPTTGTLKAWAVLLAITACNRDTSPTGPLPALQRQSEESSAPLVLHIVAPQATDPAIDKFLTIITSCSTRRRSLTTGCCYSCPAPYRYRRC